MAYLIIHYGGEVGIKGAKKSFFEKKLSDNIRSGLKKGNYEKILREHGRIIVQLAKNFDKKQAEHILKHTPGISYFCFAEKTSPSIKGITEIIVSHFGNSIKEFKIIAKGQKPEFLRALEEAVASNTNAKHSPSGKPFFVELLGEDAYVYDERVSSVGGLPVGSTAKVIALVSGGVNSSVAVYKMFKRGCSVVLVHFCDTDNKQSGNIKNLARVLASYQFKTKLYMMPWNDAEKFRMDVMLKTAEKILVMENATAIVTGDTMGSSKNLDNIKLVKGLLKYPLLSPLVGESEEEIVSQAKEIGTYQFSDQQSSAFKEDGLSLEFDTRMDDMCEEALRKAEVLTFFQNSDSEK